MSSLHYIYILHPMKTDWVIERWKERKERERARESSYVHNMRVILCFKQNVYQFSMWNWIDGGCKISKANKSCSRQFWMFIQYALFQWELFEFPNTRFINNQIDRFYSIYACLVHFFLHFIMRREIVIKCTNRHNLSHLHIIFNSYIKKRLKTKIHTYM